jgi:predicted hydrocarbon binding protein
MIVTKHISLDKDCVDKMSPYVEKHQGNFSAAMREIIERAGKSSFPNNSSTIDSSLFKWMLNEIDGILLPDNTLDELIEPGLISSMVKLEEYLNYRFNELAWGIYISLKYDRNTAPSELLVEIRGISQRTKLAACLLSQFLIKNSLVDSPLEIRSVINTDDNIKVELSRSNKKDAQDSLIRFFGQNNEIVKSIKSRPAFWKAIVNRHIVSNYNMVTLHRNFFEDILAGKVPLGEITIENIAKRPIQDIPLREMLSLIKEVYETSRVVDAVEIEKDSIILFNNYRNKDAIEKLKKILVMLLEANGHLFEAKSTANMIVLTHRPDIGIKINEIVDNLKVSNTRLDNELIMFLEFLRELKTIPDIPLSLTSLGRRIGKSLMQVYEKENRVKNWDAKHFKRAFEIIDSKIHRESEWKLEGKDLVYIIKKCNIANEGGKFDTYLCHTGRETFRGALNYAFGNKAELDIKKLLTHKDQFCEVVIRIP